MSQPNIEAPEGAVILGYGGTFKVPEGGFQGWRLINHRGQRWINSGIAGFNGDSASYLYAAPADSEVARMNTPTVDLEQPAASESAAIEEIKRGQKWRDAWHQLRSSDWKRPRLQSLSDQLDERWAQANMRVGRGMKALDACRAATRESTAGEVLKADLEKNGTYCCNGGLIEMNGHIRCSVCRADYGVAPPAAGSETPRTQALLNRELSGEPVTIGDWTSFARTLERENTALRAELAEARALRQLLERARSICLGDDDPNDKEDWLTDYEAAFQKLQQEETPPPESSGKH